MTTVLVVEDEFLVMMSITADLIAEGYDVLTASNADKAIEILRCGMTSRPFLRISKTAANFLQ